MMASAAPRWTARQFHNQPAESHQHRFLVDLWAEVERESGGRVAVTVRAHNGGIAGSDPQALEMLRTSEVEFITMMGGILGSVVPVAEIQGLPFAFTTSEQVHRANDGALGAHIARECRAKGIHRFQRGLMENGFRHMCMIGKPIRTADDLIGVKMRLPHGQIFQDLFGALEAQPEIININQLYNALKDRRVDGHENPLVITEVNKLYEVTKYVSLTAHIWSGFNLLGNLAFWERLPADLQALIERSVEKHVARQRAYTIALNAELQTTLAQRGLSFNTADVSTFRRKLGGDFYQRWKTQLGETAWSLLEAEVGRIG